MEGVCKICSLSLEGNGEVIELKQQRAADSVNECAALKGNDWAGTIKKNDKFHKVCRKEFVKRDRIPLVAETGQNVQCGSKFSPAKTRLSSGGQSVVQFDYAVCCLFCCEVVCEKVFESGQEVIKPLLKATKANRQDSKISFVQSKYLFDTTLRRELRGRMDPWACELRGRVEAIGCLRSYEAVYHRYCYRCFYKGLPKQCDGEDSTARKRIRLSTISSDDKKGCFCHSV